MGVVLQGEREAVRERVSALQCLPLQMFSGAARAIPLTSTRAKALYLCSLASSRLRLRRRAPSCGHSGLRINCWGPPAWHLRLIHLYCKIEVLTILQYCNIAILLLAIFNIAILRILQYCNSPSLIFGT